MLTPTFRDHHSFCLAGLRRFHAFADAPRDIPAAHYAVFTDPKGLATLHDTWQYIWKQWLPAFGVTAAPLPTSSATTNASTPLPLRALSK
jgi:hypothetical protein